MIYIYMPKNKKHNKRNKKKLYDIKQNSAKNIDYSKYFNDEVNEKNKIKNLENKIYKNELEEAETQETTEIEFYETFFATCYIWSDDYSSIVFLAKELARRYGLNALDSLHLACAILGDGDEFVTTEKNSKPIHRVQEITTISISD